MERTKPPMPRTLKVEDNDLILTKGMAVYFEGVPYHIVSFGDGLIHPKETVGLQCQTSGRILHIPINKITVLGRSFPDDPSQ